MSRRRPNNPRGSKTRPAAASALLETTPVKPRKLSPIEVLHEQLAESVALAKRARLAGDTDNYRVFSSRAVQIAQSLLPFERMPDRPAELTDFVLNVFERARTPKVIEHRDAEQNIVDAVVAAPATEAPPKASLEERVSEKPVNASASTPSPPQPRDNNAYPATPNQPSLYDHPAIALARFGFGPRGGMH